MDEEFGRFVVARGRSLCRTAYLLTGDWQCGEDLVQEALTRTYLRRRRLRSEAAFEPYARKVLVTLFLTSRRRRWHSELPHAQVPDSADRSELDELDRRREIWPGLMDLPRQQRAVLVLRYFDDLTYTEIAAVLGCSAGSVSPDDLLREEFRARADAAEMEVMAAGTFPASLLSGIEHRVHARIRRRQISAAVLAAAVAVAALTVSSLVPGRTGHPAGQTPNPLTDTSATPRGWEPVALGDAQISVPGAWFTEKDGGSACGGRVPGMVFVGRPPRSREFSSAGCRLTASRALIVPIGPEEPNRAGSLTGLVNGIAVIRVPGADGSVSYLVPSLGVRVTAYGPLAVRILGTLTRSPLSVVLAPGPSLPALPGWRRHDFGGIRFAAPATWRAERDNWWGGCPDGIEAQTVRLSTARGVSAPSCPPPPASTRFNAARPGVVVGAGRFAAIGLTPAGYSQCLARLGLRICVSARSNEDGLLYLAVFPPGRSRPVAVEIGLAGSGATARAIFDSIRPASAQ